MHMFTSVIERFVFSTKLRRAGWPSVTLPSVFWKCTLVDTSNQEFKDHLLIFQFHRGVLLSFLHGLMQSLANRIEVEALGT